MMVTKTTRNDPYQGKAGAWADVGFGRLGEDDHQKGRYEQDEIKHSRLVYLKLGSRIVVDSSVA